MEVYTKKEQENWKYKDFTIHSVYELMNVSSIVINALKLSVYVIFNI